MKKSDKFENAYIAILAIIIAIVVAIIGLNAYSSMKQVESNITLEELAEHTSNDIESASSSIGNNVIQSQNSLEQSNIENNGTNTNEVQTSTDNTENIINNEQTSDILDSEEQSSQTNASGEHLEETIDNVDHNIQNEQMDNEEATNTSSESQNEPSEPITFVNPVEGEIMKEFAKENLVYSDTLLEWTTHLGIDIKAEKTTVVKSAAEGVVKSIKNDPRYGLTIIIDHKDGYQTVYSNLLSSEFVVEGENVNQGQSIGTVGNTATFEIADQTHLHFELIKNGEYLDPAIYIK